MSLRIPAEQHEPFLDVTGTVIVTAAARGFQVQPASPDDQAAAGWAAPFNGRRYRTEQDAAQAVSAAAIQRALPEETSRRPRQPAVTQSQHEQEPQRADAPAAVRDGEFGFSDDLRERDSRQQEAQRQRS